MAATLKSQSSAVSMQDTLDFLIGQAILAPSGDNVQPWTFHADSDAGKIVVRVDEPRDTSPMNAGQRMSRIAVGAAVENIVHSAAMNDLEAEIEASPTTHSVCILVRGVVKHPYSRNHRGNQS